MDIETIPPGAYYPDAHYEKVIEAFGGLGLLRPMDPEGPFEHALKKAMDSNPALAWSTWC